jgi:hypothetical protein
VATKGTEDTERLRVMVVDDHAVRRGLEMEVLQQGPTSSSWEASDGGKPSRRPRSSFPTSC